MTQSAFFKASLILFGSMEEMKANKATLFLTLDLVYKLEFKDEVIFPRG